MYPKSNHNQPSSNPISVVGYGTLITHGHWKNKKNIEVCIIKNYIRILPKGNWFPYVLSLKESSFFALKFEVTEQELRDLDQYEGVYAGLFKRVETEIELKNNKKIMTFIYVPTKKTIISQNLEIDMDKNDRWKEEIKRFPEIVEKFPELIK